MEEEEGEGIRRPRKVWGLYCRGRWTGWGCELEDGMAEVDG